MSQRELILIVDDEADLVEVLSHSFSQEHYQTAVATNGKEGLERALATPTPDLIILDLMLPDMRGSDIVRRLRENTATRHVPIIMLSACSEEIDRIVAFEVGVDDYVVKPFSVRELKLRVRTHLRHVYAKPAMPKTVQSGRLKIDVKAHEATVDGETVSLTPIEFHLLRALVERTGEVLSRSQLVDTLERGGDSVKPRSVDSYVARLRKKLGAVAWYVDTVRGVGYRFWDTRV